MKKKQNIVVETEPQNVSKFHSMTLDETYSMLDCTEAGLSSEIALKRQEEYGKNALKEGKKTSLMVKFLMQFKDMMIIVLIIAALVSAVIAIVEKQPSELVDTGVILFIVILNAIIGVVQENKAENAMEALKNMNKSFSKVIRNGELVHIESDELVPGDIVQLEAGDIVPADIRLIQASSLKVEEAALTGESVPSEKFDDTMCNEDAPLGDRSNMVFSSGIVSYGRGKGVVTSTGMKTEVGKIATMLNDTSNQNSPLQKQLGKTAKLLSVMVLAVAAVIFIVSAVRGDDLLDAFMTAVAIAVAAIPEGLPAVVTIVLALGVQKMSKRNAIVKNLPSVETLGCCEIICSDKTGTLTLNQMTVKDYFVMSNPVLSESDEPLSPENYNPNSQDFELFLRGMALCNDTVVSGDKLLGDPTETALVAYARSQQINIEDLNSNWERVDEKPFDSVRKLMSTVNEFEGKKVAHIKGAPDMLLKKCKYVFENGAVREITDDDINRISMNNKRMAVKALRVLAVAVKYDNLDLDEIEQDMIFVGLVGMIDPPRAEVKDAVEVCTGAGMRAIMITGDHIDTASAIAREIGILKDGQQVILGAELDKMSDEEFESAIWNYSVYARVSPENKARIVSTFQKLGKVVAMTGDGVNDAPSIKKADIGIGMGITGTDVSKGAADLVLTDDNFATIIGAVEEGRKIFSNIKKAIQFLLSANIAEVLCLFIATIILPYFNDGQTVVFLTPIMILWINLITDSLPALSLGMEEAESDVMTYPPRKSKASLFAGRTGKDILIQGMFQTGLVMTAFCIGNYVLATGARHAEAMTMAFIALSMIQLFHSYNMRSSKNSILNKKMFSNKYLNISFLIGALLTILVVVVPPFQVVFDTVSITWQEWLISIGVAFAIVPLVEIQKAIEKAIKSKTGKKFEQ